MRLSKIKLAGFKSFVDPTTVRLPSNLVGIVGPNGCGKSNVIDAIRWVMGETSAKHLRGDSMADVIFNGSSGRKPVGTATIELSFDNSDGAIGGQYAGYSEISIKRTVSRDGTSQYFLNNTRCRRKDITSIFLGTGLGPRSYAIIEQGMVSRLIEAKPDEMRIYIEEAAGISKYKERRRETENRIRHTRDNLDRLNDLREEVDKQIRHLQRQARQAERYKALRDEERQLESEFLAIRLTGLQQELDARRAEQERSRTRLEAAIAEQRSVEASIEAAREAHAEATEAHSAAQARYYAVQADIARVEQSLGHARELRERQREDLRAAEAQLGEVAAEIDKDNAELEALEARLEQLAPDLEQARALEEASAANLQRVEEALDAWQTAWHEFSLEVKEQQQTSQVERTRIESLEAQLDRLRARQAELQTEQAGISLAESEAALAEWTRSEQAATAAVQSQERRLREAEVRRQQLRDEEQELGNALDRARAELESRRGRCEALEAVQAAALGADQDEVRRWLAREGLENEPRLAQRLVVDKPWEAAVETVLGELLQGVCARRLDEHLGGLPDGDLVMLDGALDPPATGTGTLLDKVREAGAAAHVLARVRAADSLDQALATRASLGVGESVITPDGIWLGQGWIRVHRGQQGADGLISREQEIRSLRDELRDCAHRVRHLEGDRVRVRDALARVESERTETGTALNAANRELAEAVAQLTALRQEYERARGRLSALGRDSQAVRDEVGKLESALGESRRRLTASEEAGERLEDRRPTLQRQQQELLDEYDRARSQAERDRETAARINVEYESRRASRESASTTLERVQAQRQRLEDRVTGLREQVEAGEAPLAALRAELDEHLARKVEVEQAMAERRGALDEADQHLRAEERRRAEAEKQVAAVRESLDELRVQVRETEVRTEGLADQFAATGMELAAVVEALPDSRDPADWETRLTELRGRIERMGPINLAAIEEFREQSERKEYLDSQFEDLTAALETLEKAIRKIDRETRSRFQETFDAINAGMQRLFPRLFGGGHAYLSLDGDDVLSAGVTVMARPPGKRNSHIHLLSGGEKALTAVSLIFSIFELNPAPFCLLDEVDAPLDDANVGRFCDIVREMSQTVQFIVITHNKTTMEMSSHLTGVTMHEPGVSRLVSVDIDEAVQLVAS